MKIGYARVSTYDQNLDLQKDALEKAGCERILTDTASGKNTERPVSTSPMLHPFQIRELSIIF